MLIFNGNFALPYPQPVNQPHVVFLTLFQPVIEKKCTVVLNVHVEGLSDVSTRREILRECMNNLSLLPLYNVCLGTSSSSSVTQMGTNLHISKIRLPCNGKLRVRKMKRVALKN